MRLDSWILADAASATPDGKVSLLGGGVSRVIVSSLPAQHAMLALVLRFVWEGSDADESHEVALSLISPAGAQVLSPTPAVDVPPRQPRDLIEGEEFYLHVVMNL